MNMVFSNIGELLEDVGMGNRPPSLVVRRLVPERISDGDSEETREMKSQSALAISGTEGHGGFLWTMLLSNSRRSDYCEIK